VSKAYDILEHGMMVGDRLRLDAYLEAIRRAVRPGAVVVDIGSGTGVFALAACQAGARRVYAIEPGDIIHVAREIAISNGCESRIDFIPRVSTDVTLAERADVIVLDVRSVLPDEQIPVAVDARRRFLKEGGTIIPSIDTLWAAPLSAPALYDRHVGRWNGDESGLDARPLRDAAANRWYKCRVEARQLVGEPRRWATVDYGAIDDVEIRGTLEWSVGAPAVAHGVVAWFETVLYDEVKLSNRPGEPELLYGQGYFPLPAPVALARGRRLGVELQGSGDSRFYNWRSSTHVSA
jgi:protein arginine N-methyltransferase 1